jgi:hypothetical protein
LLKYFDGEGSYVAVGAQNATAMAAS